MLYHMQWSIDNASVTGIGCNTMNCALTVQQTVTATAHAQTSDSCPHLDNTDTHAAYCSIVYAEDLLMPKL